MRVRNVKESAAHDYTLRELKLSKVGQVSILSYFRDFGNCLWYASRVMQLQSFIHSFTHWFSSHLLSAFYVPGTLEALLVHCRQDLQPLLSQSLEVEV